MPQDIKQLRKQLISKAKKRVQEKYSEKDVHVARAVSLLNDLDSAFNLLAENCIEWFGSNFPEMQSMVRDNEVYLKIVAELGERSEINEKSLERALGKHDKAKAVAEKAKASMGSSIPKQALEEIRLLAKNALLLKGERKGLESFLEKEMEKLAPNFSELAGHVLGARLLAAAGGLEKLAKMPSSTMQLLGAEKALFRHLKNRKSKGPKYGFIYGHSLVRQVQAKNKGRVARMLAGKLSIAARADFFGSKKGLAKQVLEELEQRVKSLE